MNIKSLFSKKNKNQTLTFIVVIVAYAIVEALMRTGNLKNLITSMLIPVCSYIVVALALNLVVGVSGELSLGHAGFMGIGAFTGIVVSGILSFSTSNIVIRLVAAVIAGAIVAGLIGFIISIPVLKLEGDYLAIVTLAFCQIISTLVQNVYIGYDHAGVHFSFINLSFELGKGGKMLLNGPVGATGIERISTFSAGIIMILLVLLIIFNFLNSRHGRAVMATRDDKIASPCVGVNVVKTKTIAFVLSAAIAGAGGVLYGLSFSSVSPAKFDFNTSILILVYVVLGGQGNMLGTVISTTILVMLPQVLRFLNDYRMIIYAVVLIVMMVATNNPTIKSILSKFTKNKKGEIE